MEFGATDAFVCGGDVGMDVTLTDAMHVMGCVEDGAEEGVTGYAAVHVVRNANDGTFLQDANREYSSPKDAPAVHCPVRLFHLHWRGEESSMPLDGKDGHCGCGGTAPPLDNDPGHA